jgi:hypothetical protein
MRQPMRGWWCRHREHPDFIEEAVFLSLPPYLGDRCVVEGEGEDGYYVLFAEGDGDGPGDDRLREALRACPDFQGCQEAWFLAFGERDQPTWHELGDEGNGEPAALFGATERALWAADRDLNSCGEGMSFYVYGSEEDAWDDLAASYPRIGLLRELARTRPGSIAALARAVLEGDDSALALLSDALEEAGDERAARVRSWPGR